MANKEATEYVNCLHRFGFCCLVNKPTRVREGQVPSCIDHFFVRNVEKYAGSHSRIMCSGISDHYPIVLNVSLQKCNKQIQKNNKYISKTNFEKLNQLIKQETWENVLSSNMVNECAYNFIETIQQHVQSTTEQKYVKSKDRKIKPWITEGLIKSIRHRDKLKKISTITKTHEAYQNFKEYRDHLCALIKLDYYANKFHTTQKITPKKHGN